MLLVGEETVTQSAHESGEAVTGELALVPPFLGGSQRLLNADHHKVYFKVSSRWAPCFFRGAQEPSAMAGNQLTLICCTGHAHCCWLTTASAATWRRL